MIVLLQMNSNCMLLVIKLPSHHSSVVVLHFQRSLQGPYTYNNWKITRENPNGWHVYVEVKYIIYNAKL